METETLSSGFYMGPDRPEETSLPAAEAFEGSQKSNCHAGPVLGMEAASCRS